MRGRVAGLAVVVLVFGTVVLVPAPAGAGAPSSKVDVLSRGSSARVELRLAIPPGATEQGVMAVGASVIPRDVEEGVQPNGGPSPSSVTELGLGVRSSAVNRAQTRVLVSATGSNLASPAGDPLAGVATELTIDHKGVIRSSRRADVPDPGRFDVFALYRVYDQLSQFVTPLPSGPVGPGARWRVKSTLDLMGGRIDQVAVYTLQSVEGSRAVINVQLSQSATEQRVAKTSHMLGDFSMTKYRMTGQRTTEIDLARALPVLSRSKLSGHATYREEGSGIATTMTTKDITIDTSISSTA